MSFVKSNNSSYYSSRMMDMKTRDNDISSKIKGEFANIISSVGQVAGTTFNNEATPLKLKNKSIQHIEIIGRCSDYLNSQLSIAPIYELDDGANNLSGNFKKLYTETHSFIQEDPAVGTQGTIRIILSTLADKVCVKFLNTGGTNNNVDISAYYK